MIEMKAIEQYFIWVPFMLYLCEKEIENINSALDLA